MLKSRSRWSLGWILAINCIVTTFSQIERKLLSVRWVLKISTKVTHLRVGTRVDSYEHDLPCNPLATDLKIEHGWYSYRWSHAGYLITSSSFDFINVPLWILKARERVAFKNNVRKNSVDTSLHLIGKTCHDGIDYNHCCYTKRHAYDACQCNPSRTKISPTKKEFVHIVNCSISCQCGDDELGIG